MPASLPTPHAADAMAAVAVLNFRGCERLTAFGTRWCRRRRGRRRSRDRRRRRRLGGGFARPQFSAQMRPGLRQLARDKDRQSVREGKGGVVRLELGGRRITKKKKRNNQTT